jgi:predicted 2-oxoglutarate/Fe(II)-dependent dioxygenase YbiX
MIKEEIAPGIMVYSNVIPNSENLYKDIEEGLVSANILWVPASVKADSDPGVNTDSRDTSTFGVPYSGAISEDFTSLQSSFNSTLNNLFFENFDPIERDYKSYFGTAAPWHDSYAILKYGVGQKFTNHIDDHQDYHRRISTVYYLNDNYTGGEINFPRFNITFKPKANQMIFFPSTYVYNHSVLPVIEGERYAVVSWMR